MDTPRTSHKNAHSNFRKGLSDYHDGENVTDQLGNDDHKFRTNLPDPYADSVNFDGSEAQGNDLTDDDLDDEENEFHGKEEDNEQEESQRP